MTTPLDPGAGEGPAVPPPGSGEGPAQVPAQPPAATNRTGLIIGIVVAILVVLGGGAALLAGLH